jgi:hypothetical protein
MEHHQKARLAEVPKHIAAARAATPNVSFARLSFATTILSWFAVFP